MTSIPPTRLVTLPAVRAAFTASTASIPRLTRRPLSTASGPSTSSSPGYPSTPRIAPLPHRSVLELSGPDVPKFLRGLACKDVESLNGGYSGFMNASGRVLHTTFIIPISPTRYLITHDSPSSHPNPLSTFFPPFKLRNKVRIRDVSSEWDAWATWGLDPGSSSTPAVPGTTDGPAHMWRLGSGGAAERVWNWAEVGRVRGLGLSEVEAGCWDLRAGWGGLGRHILVPKGVKPSLRSSHDEALTSDYHLRRMLLGVPEGPDEVIPGQALPLESCMDVHGGVDFRKGCYLGQELTVRTYHTGATRKRILPIRLFPLTDPSLTLSPSYLTSISTSPSASSSSSTPAIPSAVDITYTPSASSASKKPRSAGKLLALHDSVGTVGLGLVRLEMVERCWWVNTPSSGQGGEGERSEVGESVEEWLGNGKGRLTVNVGGDEWGVYVDKGEGYGAALQEIEKSASSEK